MSTIQQSEVHAFFNGESRPVAIRDYLNLKCAREVARLAASMAPRSKSFDPIALVNAALVLRTEAEAGLVRCRESMVGRMNFSTLLDLARELRVSDKIHASEDDEKLSDPVTGPVLRFIQKVVHGNSAECAAKDAARVEEALAIADGRTMLSRPSLPCDLERALRYSANDPDSPWPVLERAFKDFLGIYRTKCEAEQGINYRTDIKKQLDQNTKELADLKLKAKADPELLLSQRKLEEGIKQLGAVVNEWKAIQFYRDFFIPGSETPPGVAEESARIYEVYWHPPGSVFQESSLAFFATDFHAFWQTHGQTYFHLHAADEKQKEAVANRNRKSATKAAETRDHKKWLGHTTSFITFLRKHGNNKTPAAIQNLVKTYAWDYSALKDKGAKAKVEAFLGTLCNPAGGDWNASTARGVLQKSGIKACAETTIDECLSLLNTVLGRGRETK